MIENEWSFLNAKTKAAVMKEGLALAEEFAYNLVDRYENSGRNVLLRLLVVRYVKRE